MGKYNSSIYRVSPFMKEIEGDLDKINKFLKLFGIKVNSLPEEYFYDGNGHSEHPLKPTLKHLIGLINFIYEKKDNYPATTNEDRKEFYYGSDEERLLKKEEAIKSLKEIYDTMPTETRKWFIFEGYTYPDLLVIGKDYVLIGEGKWTESHITEETTNLRLKCGEHRNQMARHIQAALNEFKDKKIYAFYLVDDNCKYLNDLTPVAFEEQLGYESVALNPKEKQTILNCFKGYTTWQKLEELFGVHFKTKKEIDKENK